MPACWTPTLVSFSRYSFVANLQFYSLKCYGRHNLKAEPVHLRWMVCFYYFQQARLLFSASCSSEIIVYDDNNHSNRILFWEGIIFLTVFWGCVMIMLTNTFHLGKRYRWHYAKSSMGTPLGGFCMCHCSVLYKNLRCPILSLLWNNVIRYLLGPFWLLCCSALYVPS